MITTLKRIRKEEIEQAVKDLQKRNYDIVLPIQKASDYYQNCLDRKVEKYFKIDGIQDYAGYICVMEGEDDENRLRSTHVWKAETQPSRRKAW